MLNPTPSNPYKTKLELIGLVQALPESRLMDAKNFLEAVLSHSIDPVLLTLLTAPIDDEPLTPEEIEESEANWQAVLRGEGIPWGEIKPQKSKKRKVNGD